MNERTEQGKKEEKKILVFAGTTEGRILSGRLSACGVPHTVCVATEYGEELLEENPLVRVHQGRMDADAIRTFLLEEGFGAVVDATHPYARTVTENIRRAAEETMKDIAPAMARIEEMQNYNQQKMLAAFNRAGVSESHFVGSTGYGYGDRGRDVLDQVYAYALGAEDALVRHNFVSGTHTQIGRAHV